MAKSTVAVKFTGDVAGLKKATGDAEGTLKGFGTKAAGVLKSGMLAAGAIGGAALAKGFSDALSQEKSVDKAAASLGLTPEESAELGKISGALYADAYGESFAEVTDAVAAVKASLGRLDENADIEGLTANALDFAAAFDLDVNEAVEAAGLLLSNDLVDSGEEAFDLLVAAAQKLTPTAREELLAATKEYSTFFSDLGISGQEAFGAIVAAAEKGGTYGVDKLGDALKEFGIRATDGSTASVEAFETIGLNAERMAGKILEGGDTAREAFDEIVESLLAVEDPSEQAQAAIALFGTPLEDLSVTEIPEFLSSLGDMGNALGDVEGAAEDMGNTLNDNTATKIEAFKRKALQKLADFVAETLIPALEDFAAWFDEEMQPKIDDAVRVFEEDWLPVLREVHRVFRDDLIPILRAFADVIELFVLPAIGNFVRDVLEGVDAMVTAWENLKGAFATVVQKAGEMAFAVSEKIRGLLSFVKTLPASVSSVAGRMWNGIKDAFAAVINWVIDKWNSLDFTLPGILGGGTIGLPDIDPVSVNFGTPTSTSGSHHAGNGIRVMAHGGLATHPMLAQIGDAGIGDPEVVSPESLMRKIVREESGKIFREESGRTGGTEVIQVVLDRRVIAEAIRSHERALR